jgi:hypothetical protein
VSHQDVTSNQKQRSVSLSQGIILKVAQIQYSVTQSQKPLIQTTSQQAIVCFPHQLNQLCAGRWKKAISDEYIIIDARLVACSNSSFMSVQN